MKILMPRMGLDNLDVVVDANVGHILFDTTGDEDENNGCGVTAKGVVVTLKRCIVPALSIPLLATIIPELPCLFGRRNAKDVGRKI